VTSGDETIGGVPYVIGNLARHLQKRGHEVIFLYSGTTFWLRKKTTRWGFTGFDLNLQVPFGDRHPIIGLLLFALRFPVGLFQVIRLIRKHRIQVVNIHYPAVNFFYIALCRRLLRITLVTSVHGADLFPDGMARATYPKAIKLLLNSSDRIVAPSKAYREDVASVFPQLRGKIVCIHNGVDLDELNRICAAPASTSRVLHPYILCISAYKEQKAIDVLIQAFKQVQGSDSLLKLILVGAGHLRGELEQLASALGIHDRIEFLGHQSRTEVANLIRGCKVFVLPSRFETFGIVILEAMACKKPVVATTAGGIPEIIENGINGILVEPDDDKALAEALITVLKDENLRINIAVKGYSMVRERFRIDDTGMGYEDLFADLITDQAQKKAA
jgi:N-acetyl-alpha-D-glucosaminyl L-malate synthase BshA